MNAVVKFLMSESKANLAFGREVESIRGSHERVAEDGEPSTWVVVDKHGESSEFDAVIITAPMPQVRSIVCSPALPCS